MGSALLLGRLCAAGRMEIEFKPTGHGLPDHSGMLLGLLTGSVAAAISQGSHQVEIEVDVHGRILFRFNPVKAARRA